MSSHFWISNRVFFSLALGVDVLLPLCQLAGTLILFLSHLKLESIFPHTSTERSSCSPSTFFHFVVHMAADRTGQPSRRLTNDSSVIEASACGVSKRFCHPSLLPRHRTWLLASISGQSRLSSMKQQLLRVQGAWCFANTSAEQAREMQVWGLKEGWFAQRWLLQSTYCQATWLETCTQKEFRHDLVGSACCHFPKDLFPVRGICDSHWATPVHRSRKIIVPAVPSFSLPGKYTRTAEGIFALPLELSCHNNEYWL